MRRFIAAIFLTIAVYTFVAAPGGRPSAVAQVAGETIRFSMSAHDGRQVSEAYFQGRYVLIQFGYTWCPDVCPMELALLAEVLDKLGPAVERLQPLFISFDPGRDSATMLADYVSNFHPTILGLSGTQTETNRLLKSLGVILIREKESNGNYTFAHSARTYLIGPDSDFRGSIESLAPPEKVAAGLVKFLSTEP